jgi:hypothetical protein
VSEEKIISADSNLDNLSDIFSFETPSWGLWTGEETESTIAFGYGNKNLNQIDGFIDTLTISRHGRNNATMSVNGRDYLKKCLESNFTKTYLWKLPQHKRENKGSSGTSIVGGLQVTYTPKGGLPSPAGTTAAYHASHFAPKNEFGEAIPYSYGNILASSVAREACNSIGFELVWDAPDYYIVNEKEDSRGFNDMIANVLKDLIEPMNQTDMFKIEIFIQGKTNTNKDAVIYVKKRIYPYKADYTLDLDNIRIKSLTLTKELKKDRIIRNIYVSQDEISTSVTAEAEDSGYAKQPPEVPPAEEPEHKDVWLKAPETVEKIVETKDSNGNVVVREVFTTYSINGILVKETKQVFKAAGYVIGTLQAYFFELTEDRVKEHYYVGGGPYSYFTKVDYTMETADIYSLKLYCTVESKVVEANHIMEYPSHGIEYRGKFIINKQIIREDFTYNAADEIITQRVFEENRFYAENGTQTSISTKETITSNEYFAKDQIRSTITRYENGVFIETVQTISAGQLPGPKKVGPVNNTNRKNRSDAKDTDNTAPSSGGGGDPPTYDTNRTFWHKKFIVSSVGQDVKIHNNLLSKAQLIVIGQEIKYEYSKTRYRLSMDLLPLPYLKKGTVLKIDGTISDGYKGYDTDEPHEIDLNDFSFYITKVTYRKERISHTEERLVGTLEGVTYL